MLLIPIGHENSEIRRHAWISYAIIALNVLVFVAGAAFERHDSDDIEKAWRAAAIYLAQHPYLRTPPELDAVANDGFRELVRERRREIAAPADDARRDEQARLDELAAAAAAMQDDTVARRFGYVPRDGGLLLRGFTSMFVHAGFLHLAGNLLYFFLSGPFIEDVFGRAIFAGLYVTGGFAAVIAYGGLHPDSNTSLVGASGAIAAVMGAYLVRFLRAKVQLLFIPFLFAPRFHFRFFLPAFVILPVWFTHQLASMLWEGDGGVAFSAHVGGFAYGVAFALAIQSLGIEKKYIEPVVLKETTWSLDDRVVKAMQLHHQGDRDGATRELGALLRSPTVETNVLKMAVDLARDADDSASLDTAAVRLLNRYLEEKKTDLATELIHDVTSDRFAVLPKFLARSAAFAERTSDRDWALTLYARLTDTDPNGPGTVSALVKMSSLLRASGRMDDSRHALLRARAHPACTGEWPAMIDAKLDRL